MKGNGMEDRVPNVDVEYKDIKDIYSEEGTITDIPKETMKTDKKIEEIRKELESVDIEVTEVNGKPTYLTFYMPDGEKLTMWEWINRNYTPTTEVQKAVEDGVRGFAKHMDKTKYSRYEGDLDWIQKEAETYLQSLDKGDGDE